MKKTLIVFVLIAINSQIFSINEEPSKKDTQQLTKKDIAKIGSAALGCLFFTYAFLTSYHSHQDHHQSTHELSDAKKTNFFCLP